MSLDFNKHLDAKDFEPQGMDGEPHMTYYVEPFQMSFVWDGISDFILVSVGGYGEPPTTTILARFPGTLESFRDACNEWFVDNLPEISQAFRAWVNR